MAGIKVAVEEAQCNATAIRKAARRLTLLYDDALSPCGLRCTQHAVLAEIGRRNSAPTMRELADALVMDRSGLGHNLRPLEREGLIEFFGSAEDRRRRHVGLTLAGAQKLEEAKVLWRSAQSRFHRLHGKARSAELRAMLLAIAADERLATFRD